MYDALDGRNRKDGIKDTIITGNGKSFCSGLGLSIVGKEHLQDPCGDVRDTLDIFSKCKKPIINAVTWVRARPVL